MSLAHKSKSRVFPYLPKFPSPLRFSVTHLRHHFFLEKNHSDSDGVYFYYPKKSAIDASSISDDAADAHSLNTQFSPFPQKRFRTTQRLIGNFFKLGRSLGFLTKMYANECDFGGKWTQSGSDTSTGNAENGLKQRRVLKRGVPFLLGHHVEFLWQPHPLHGASPVFLYGGRMNRCSQM